MESKSRATVLTGSGTLFDVFSNILFVCLEMQEK